MNAKMFFCLCGVAMTCIYLLYFDCCESVVHSCGQLVDDIIV